MAPTSSDTGTSPAPGGGGAGRDRRVVVMVGLGLFSGLVCASVEYWPDAISNLIPGRDENVVGVVFGIVVGVYLYRLGLATAATAVAFLVASEGAWLVAHYFATDVAFDYAERVCAADPCTFALVGIPSGVLGAGLLVIAIWFLFPFFRQPRLAMATVAVGGLAGALLGFRTVFVLFPIWQAAFAYCLARGFPPPASPEARHSL